MSDKVEPPPQDNVKWLASAEQHILSILRDNYGAIQLDRTEADLLVGQRLVDDQVFDAQQLLEWQCLGVLLGNVFAAQTSMQWAAVTNNYGMLLALHDPGIAFTLYPIQMISQRAESGRVIDIPQLFRSMVDDLNLSKR